VWTHRAQRLAGRSPGGLRTRRLARGRAALQRAAVPAGRGHPRGGAQDRAPPLGPGPLVGGGSQDRPSPLAGPRRDRRPNAGVSRRPAEAAVPGGRRRLLRMEGRRPQTPAALHPSSGPRAVRPRRTVGPLVVQGRRGDRVVRHPHAARAPAGRRRTRPHAPGAGERGVGTLARRPARRRHVAPPRARAGARRLSGEPSRQRSASRRCGMPRAQRALF